MERHDPVWTSSCARDRQPGSVGAKCGFACYLLLAVGIWVAYLWLVYSRPLARSPPSPPAAAGVLTEGPAPPNQPLPLIEVTDSTNNRQEDPVPQVTVVASAIRSTSVTTWEPLTFSPDPYTVRKRLVLDIQHALGRARCYRGEMTGLWSPNTKRALSAFISAANARLPIEQPDDILLHLVQGHDSVVCGERRSGDSHLAGSTESNSRRAAPSGLMGIGGPKPEMVDPFVKRPASTIPSSQPAVGNSLKQTRRKRNVYVERIRPLRVPFGERSVQELMMRPFGTF